MHGPLDPDQFVSMINFRNRVGALESITAADAIRTGILQSDEHYWLTFTRRVLREAEIVTRTLPDSERGGRRLVVMERDDG